jgi:general secretion pathway protein A
MRQLKDRISVRLSIEALSANEVEYYIQHRWRIAGGKKPAPFSPGAIGSVARWSRGIPRLINSICDNALMSAFADEASNVSADHVESSARDLRLIENPAAKVATPASTAAPSATPMVLHPLTIKALEQNGVHPRRPSILVRWAEKLGLGYRRS